MKHVILASLLFAAPAIAAEPPPTASDLAWQSMYNGAIVREQYATKMAFELESQVNAFKKEVADLQKQVSDLKAATDKPKAN